jgi:hypothetical protein
MGRMLVIFLVLAGLGAMGAPPHRWRVGPAGLGVFAMQAGPDGYLWVVGVAGGAVGFWGGGGGGWVVPV